MIIKADKEAQKLLGELADVVLKSVGLQGYNKVGLLLNSVQLLEPGTAPVNRPVEKNAGEPTLEVVKETEESKKED